MSAEPLANLFGNIPTVADEQLADRLRMLAFRIMWEHPVSAAHLTVAAAGIAPAGWVDAQLADFFADDLIEFSNELASLNKAELCLNQDDGRLTTNGIRADRVGGELGNHLLKPAIKTHA